LKFSCSAYFGVHFFKWIGLQYNAEFQYSQFLAIPLCFAHKPATVVIQDSFIDAAASAALWWLKRLDNILHAGRGSGTRCETLGGVGVVLEHSENN